MSAPHQPIEWVDRTVKILQTHYDHALNVVTGNELPTHEELLDARADLRGFGKALELIAKNRPTTEEMRA